MSLLQLEELAAQFNLSQSVLSSAEENVEWCKTYLEPIESYIEDYGNVL